MDNFRSQSCPKTFCKSENKNHAASEDSELGELSKVNDLKRYFPKSVQLADIIKVYDNDLDIFGESEQMNSQINENIEQFSNKNISNENTATNPAPGSSFIPLQQENPEIRPSYVSAHEEQIGNYSTNSHSFGLENNATKSHISKANMRANVETFTTTLPEQIQVQRSNSIAPDSSDEYRTVIDIRIPESFSKMDILHKETSDSVENYLLPSTQTFSGSSLFVNERDSLENLNRFQSNSGIKQHAIVERNLEQVICNVCQRELKTASGLIAHMRIHLEVKSYKCDICEKSFTQKRNFQVHFRLHTSDKLYECATCKKSFTQKRNLKRHERVHTDDKPFACETCGKFFTQKTYLKAHARVHTDEKPFVCKTCGKPFTRKCDLQQHVRVHTGETPFSCGTCGKSFKQRSHLSTHARVHTGEKPFTCEACGKSFTQKCNLKSHARLHTPGNHSLANFAERG